MTALAIYQPEVIDGEIIAELPANSIRRDAIYPRCLFSFDAAYQRVVTASRSAATRHAYTRDLRVFLQFLADRLPTEPVMADYVAYHRANNAKDSTINRYLASARQFCRHLSNQKPPAASIRAAAEGFGIDPWTAMIDLENALTAMREAGAYRLISQDERSYDAPIMQHGTRLSLIQLKEMAASIDRSTLRGKQDAAIIAVLALSLIRRAECARLTLANFGELDGEAYRLTVKGKRNNVTPVSCNSQAYDAIMDWAAAYNAAIPADDPRQITRESSIWRPIHSLAPDTPLAAIFRPDALGYKICFSPASVGATVGRVAYAYDRDLYNLSAHDLRRTGAYLAYKNGYDLKQIQVMLRHKSLAVTEKYIGNIIDFSAADLGRKVKLF